MARIARVIAPELPHHIIQRGNRRQQVFFNEDDYNEYLKLLADYCHRFKTDILAYCLMPNHIHLIAVPQKLTSLAQAIGETHRNYTRFINFREGWRGYLWQGRFSSYVLDERYLLSATRYILLNPVKAKLAKTPWDYMWSSAKHHLKIKTNSFIKDTFLQNLIVDWKDFLDTAPTNDDVKLFQLHERTGRPLGDNTFIEKLGMILSIDLKKKKAGRKKKK